MIKDDIVIALKASVNKIDPTVGSVDVVHQEKEGWGDFSTPVALKLAKQTKQSPQEIAKQIVAELNDNNAFSSEVTPNGFINFFLKPTTLQKELQSILTKNESYGVRNSGTGKNVIIEFISANPTGPLTLGNGRGGFMGDTLARVLTHAGYTVHKEYYVNDGGNQVDFILANSIRRALGYAVDVPEGTLLYGGVYLKKIADIVEHELGDLDLVSNEKVGLKAAKLILDDLIKPTIKSMGIHFDSYFSERTLTKAKLDQVMAFLVKKHLVFEQEGAIWFQASKYGRQKDQVLVTSKGLPSYLYKDIAYYYNKLVKRGFDQSVIYLGADHHGLVESHMGAASAMGFEGKVKILIFQLVKLIKNGQEFKMSKRRGEFVTIDELLELVSLDAARFFFINTHINTHMNFDLDLAQEKSEKNPVFYVQYAHARMSSILTKASYTYTGKEALSKLNRQTELDLIKDLAAYPEMLDKVIESYDLTYITRYLIHLADTFHHYYEDVRIISDEKDLSEARLALVYATRQLMRNSLNLIGVSHPDHM
jgi:arginyl-tRNA synthetase